MVDQPGYVGRIVLQVPIEGHDDVTHGGVEPRGERRGLSEVAPQDERPKVLSLGGEGLQEAGCAWTDGVWL